MHSPSKGESHHTLHTHVSPIPESTQPQGVSVDFQSTVLQMLTSLTQRLHLIESDVALIKNHLIPTSTSHPEPPPHTPPPSPPPGSPPKPPSPPREPFPDTQMRDASRVSDSLSPQSDAAKGEKSQAEGEHQSLVKGQAEGEPNQELAEDSISSSSDDDREGFLDTSFLQEYLLPLITGELSDVESEDEGNLQTGKRKRASAGPSGAGSSSGAGPSSPPKKKKRTIEELAADWGMSIEEAKDLSAEHVAALKNIAIETADAEVVKEIAAEEGGEAS